MHKLKTSILFSLFIPLFCSVLSVSCDDDKEMDMGKSNVVQTKWEDIEEETPKKQTPSKDYLSSKKSSLKSKPAPQKVSNAKYQLQLGAFINPKNANRFYLKLKKKGYKVQKVKNKSTSKTWHTIRLKGFKTLKSAHQTAEQIAKTENIEVAVMKHNHFNKIVRSTLTPVKRKTPQTIFKDKKTKFTLKKATNKTVLQKNSHEEDGKFIKAIIPKKKTPTFEGPLNYSFQVGGLLSAPVAITQKNKLRKKGYKAFILKEKDTMNNEVWSTVQVGYFRTLLKADQAAQEFFKTENIPVRARDIRKK